jgi:hypothetical protein
MALVLEVGRVVGARAEEEVVGGCSTPGRRSGGTGSCRRGSGHSSASRPADAPAISRRGSGCGRSRRSRWGRARCGSPTAGRACCSRPAARPGSRSCGSRGERSGGEAGSGTRLTLMGYFNRNRRQPQFWSSEVQAAGVPGAPNCSVPVHRKFRRRSQRGHSGSTGRPHRRRCSLRSVERSMT